MPTATHYSRAPIIEAIIDLRVSPVDDFEVGQVIALKSAFGEQVQVERLRHNELQVEVDETHLESKGKDSAGQPKTQFTQRDTGFVFTNKSARQKMQARLDGFTFTKSTPYQEWESFRGEAQRMWNKYRALYPFKSVTRVALRYINRIDMPLNEKNQIDLEDYLTVLPRAPFWTIPSQGRGFFMQLQLHQADLDCELILNEAMLQPTDGKNASVILDFDLFKERFKQPWQESDDAQIWEFLEELRVRKNVLFESSITEKVKERIR